MRAVVVAAVAVVAGLAAAASADPLGPQHKATVTKHVSGTVTSVRIATDSGRVHVVPGEATTVVAHEAWNLQQPTLDVSLADGVLNVKSSCNTATTEGPVDIDVTSVLNNCTDDLDLIVPADVHVVAHSAGGAIRTRGIHGPQRLHTGSGRVVVHRAVGAVTASSGGGRILTSRVHGRQDLHTGSGSVEVAHAIGDVSARSAGGHIKLTGVGGRTVTAQTGSGWVDLAGVAAHTITLHSDGGGIDGQLFARRLSATTGSGHVTVTDVETPRQLTARSAGGQVTVDVPSGVYAVSATSAGGHVSVTGIKVDLEAPRTITAHSGSGRVTVAGQPGRGE